VTQICQYAPVNSTRAFNSTHSIQCCQGPINPTSYYQVPLTLQSCSPTLVPHKTIVNYNGKIMYLTILTYSKCTD
jgi:hypothetical protein